MADADETAPAEKPQKPPRDQSWLTTGPIRAKGVKPKPKRPKKADGDQKPRSDV